MLDFVFNINERVNVTKPHMCSICFPLFVYRIWSFLVSWCSLKDNPIIIKPKYAVMMPLISTMNGIFYLMKHNWYHNINIQLHITQEEFITSTKYYYLISRICTCVHRNKYQQSILWHTSLPFLQQNMKSSYSVHFINKLWNC